MAYDFPHSRNIIRDLATRTARTPPLENESPLVSVDRSLTILGRASDIHKQRIEAEFVIQREFITAQIKEVDTRVDRQFQKLEEQLEETDKRIDKRFAQAEKKLDERFKEADSKIDERFREVEKRFEEVDKKIDAQHTTMRGLLFSMQRMAQNSLRVRGWEEIHPVFDHRGEMQTPEYFPRNIRQFWKLKEPKQLDRLTDLLRFYRVQGYQEWDIDSIYDSDDSSEVTDDSAPTSVRLDDAVQRHPEIAHRTLAAHLGLVYGNIRNFMERAEGFAHNQVIGKRLGRDDQASEGERKKKINLSDLTEVTSPIDPTHSQGSTDVVALL